MFRQAEEPGRIRRQELDEPAQGDDVSADEPVEEDGDGRFQADDPERRLFEADFLFLGRVGRVVRGDDVDDAVRTASTRASTSSALRRGGFILKLGSCFSRRASVRRR